MGCRLGDSTPVGWLSDTFVPETSDWFGRPVHYYSALYNATRRTIHRGLSSPASSFHQERRSEPQCQHRCVEGNLAEPSTEMALQPARLLHALEDPLDRLEAPIEGLPFRAPLADRTEPSGGADGHCMPGRRNRRSGRPRQAQRVPDGVLHFPQYNSSTWYGAGRCDTIVVREQSRGFSAELW